MIVGMKDAVKLFGVSVIALCAVLVCTLFLNYRIDLLTVREFLTTEQEMLFFKAQKANSEVVCLVTGGCLLLTSVVTLLFYIKHYIDTHKKELGILKALGYENGRIASGFWVFGSSVFTGAGIGFLLAWLMMPLLYHMQNKDAFLPEVPMRFHPTLFCFMVLLPAVFFSVLACFYARIRLKVPPLRLIREESVIRQKERKNAGKNQQGEEGRTGRSAAVKEQVQREAGSFVRELKRTTLREKKILVFFIVFSSFCFSAMTQMSFSMRELASWLMGAMMMVIGLVLAVTTLFLAVTTVVRGNAKTIAMMRTFGYSQKECCNALLGVYRPAAYIGFAVGTVYQYALLRIMVDIVFRDVGAVPAYTFHVPRMFLSLACFLILYEIMMYGYSEKMRRIPIREIMAE